MNVWPNALPSSGAMARARMSVVPPAAKGTTMRTGRFGQLPDCANAGATQEAASAASALRRFNTVRFMSSSICIDTGSPDDGAPLRDFALHELLVLGGLDALVRHHHGAQALLAPDEFRILQRDFQRV